MHAELRQAYDKEMNAAIKQSKANNLDEAFDLLEREHTLG